MTVRYYGPNIATKELFNKQLVESPPPFVAIDAETISLKEKLPIGFAVATAPDEAWYFQTYPELDPEIELIRPLLANGKVKTVYQNAMFDVKALPAALTDFTIDDSNIADTLVMARLCGVANVKLGEQASEQLGITLENASNLMAKHGAKDMLGVPTEEVAKMCASHATATLRLFFHYLPNMDTEYFKVEMAAIPILVDMSQRGLKIDQESLLRESVRLEELVEYYRNICKEHDFNPGSPQQVGYIIAKRGTFLPMNKSKKGYRTDEKVLQFVDDPLAAVVLNYREANTLLTRYVRPLIGLERVYTDYSLDTVIGRTTSSKGGEKEKTNLQNWPPEMRYIFMPDSGTFTHGDFCLHPDTRVLTDDLRWARIKDVQEGDKLVAFDEYPAEGKGKRRKLRQATVTHTTTVKRKAFYITLTDGREIVASKEHPWLVLTKRDTTEWAMTGELAPGTAIKQLVEPWEQQHDYETGYLAGALDSEGWLTQMKTGHELGYGQNEGEALEYVRELLGQYGFHLNTSMQESSRWYTYREHTRKNLHILRINNLCDIISLLGQVRPKRLLPKFKYEGREPGDKNGRAYVESIVSLGETIDMVNIETTTGTFIAEGLLTHNSQEHLRILMLFSGDRKMQEIYAQPMYLPDGTKNPEADIHTMTARDMGIDRGIAKRVNFGVPYGATARVLQDNTKIRDIRVCQDFLDRWYKVYPDAAEWLRGAQEYARNHGKSLPTLFGRQVTIPEEWNKWGKLDRDAMDRKAVNYPILGSDGEVMKRALIICEREKLPMAVQVHDSIDLDGDCEFPIEELEGIAPVHIPFQTEKNGRWK